MNVRGIVAAALAALWLVTPGTAGAQAPTPSPSPKPATCTNADAMRRSGALDDARKEYAAARAAGAGTCVTNGLPLLAQKYLDRGLALQGAGLTEASNAAFVAAVDLDNRLVDEVATALGPQRAFALAEQLRKRGLDAEARQLVVDALKTHPSPSPAPSDKLEQLFDDEERVGLWQAVVDNAAPWARSAAEVVIGALLAWLAFRFLSSRMGPERLRIGDFTGPSADGNETKATRSSTEFAALARGKVRVLAEAEPGGRLDLAGASGGPVTVPATVTEAVQQAKLVEAVLQLVQHLLPARERTLSGVLLAASTPRGHGVALTLSSKWGHPRATRTVWANELPTTAFDACGNDSYLPFVIVAAAWTLAEFQPRRFPALGTADPLSFAAAAIGAAEQGATW